MKSMLYVNLDFENYRNKTLAQLKSFGKNKYSTYLFTVKGNDAILYEVCNGIIEKEKILGTIQFSKKNKIKYYNYLYNKIYQIIEKYEIDFIYIRRIGINIMFLNLNKINKKVKIVYELPTYPFDKTHSIKANIMQKFENFYLTKIAKRNIDVFPVILQNETKLLDNMLSISNGINIENFNINDRIKTKIKENQLNLVGIAHLNHWHGYDRVLNAMLIENNIKVTFTIYSNDTQELEILKQFVKNNNLEEKVFFKKYDVNTNLMEEINNFDVAIGGIGYHRRNATYDTSIKNKEYCALCIPFITACKDLSFNDDFKYLYRIPADDSNVDFEKIYNWYKEIAVDDYITYMYNYAQSKLSFDVAIDKILKEVEKED